MLTGKQIREARLLLGCSRLRLSRAARLTVNLMTAVESSDGEAWLSEEQEGALRRVFEDAGVDLTADGARLKANT